MTITTASATTDVERQLGNLKTRWRESGDGSAGTVLMLHSIGLNRLAFDPLRAALPSSWRIVSFDLPGHGAAVEAAGYGWEQWVCVVREAMDVCGTEHLHLLGHSMGGALAACAAALNTEAMRSLALVATPPQGFPVFAARADDTRRHGVDAQVSETLPRWFGDNPSDADGEAMAYASASLNVMAASGLAMAWDALATFRGYHGIAEKLPRVLLVAGELDRSTPPAAMQDIANQLVPERMQMEVVSRAGHMLPLTHAKQMAPLLTAHWGAERT